MTRPTQYDPKEGYPRGKDIWYSCLRCRGEVQSLSKTYFECSCRNFHMDPGANRLGVEDHEQFAIYDKRVLSSKVTLLAGLALAWVICVRVIGISQFEDLIPSWYKGVMAMSFDLVVGLASLLRLTMAKVYGQSKSTMERKPSG